MESRAPAVSRIAPTTPEATSVTARQDTGSAQTAVTATVRQVLRQHRDFCPGMIWKASSQKTRAAAFGLTV